MASFKVSVYAKRDGAMVLLHSQMEDDEHNARWMAGQFAVLGVPFDGAPGKVLKPVNPAELYVNVSPGDTT